MKENVRAHIDAIRNELKTADSSTGRGQTARQIAALMRSAESICDILLGMCQHEQRGERMAAEATARTTEIELLGETLKSNAGYWFRVTRVTYATAPRIRVELMREDRVLRSLDSTDHAFRELGGILVGL